MYLNRLHPEGFVIILIIYYFNNNKSGLS